MTPPGRQHATQPGESNRGGRSQDRAGVGGGWLGPLAARLLGCTRPPARTDVHHLVACADGGSNDLGNLVLLCRRHHVLWHLGKLDYPDLHIPWHPRGGSRASPAA